MEMNRVQSERVSRKETNQKEWWCVDFGQNAKISKEAMDRLSEGFFRFTPDVIQGRNRLFLEMSQTKQFFNFNTFMNRSRVLGAREGQDGAYWRYGVGTSIPEAWVQTRWRSRESKHLPLESYFDFVDPLTQFELSRAQRERLHVFQALGMRNLGSLFSVAKEAWLVRFGEEYDQFLENFEFGQQFPWKRFSPSQVLEEKTEWNAEEYVIDSEALIFKMKPILDRLSERLYHLRRALKKMEIVLKLERAVPDRVIELSFAFPQTSRVLLLKLIREKISRVMDKDPLSDPVVQIEIKVVEAVKREHETSRFHFSAEESKEEGASERWLELISYLGLKLESQARVFQAETTEHYLPEKSWKKTLIAAPNAAKKFDSVSHLYVKRPFTLLPKPESLFRVGPYLKKGEELWKIGECSDVEHLQGYAWDVDDTGGFDRTYYRVKVRGGQGESQLWWIFKDERLGKLKLHGVY